MLLLHIGLTKGTGALFGILGTLLTPLLVNKCKISFEKSGILTIWLFWLCLLPTGIKFFTQKVLSQFNATKNVHFLGNDTSDAYIILGCMIVARCGLWAFDLVENQLMQIKVRKAERARASGVQVAVSQLFTVVINVLAMIFSTVNQFYILIFITLGVIGSACIMYTLWALCPCCGGVKGRGINYIDQEKNEANRSKSSISNTNNKITDTKEKNVQYKNLAPAAPENVTHLSSVSRQEATKDTEKLYNRLTTASDLSPADSELAQENVVYSQY